MFPQNQFQTTQPIATDRYYGIYYGKVEQRIDPERMGRVKVRIFGLHGDEMQVEDLPWALPNATAWNKGGFFNVPPIGTVVTIQFQTGDPEYPVWTGGHWGIIGEERDLSALLGVSLIVNISPEPEAPDGQGAAANTNWASSSFGGKRIEEGPLKQEEIKDALSSDAPNNFGFSSPLHKHIELDDRKGREKVKLADYLDNMLWLNSEHASITLETSQGIQGGTEVFGLTANSDPAVMSWQMYGAGGTYAGDWSILGDLNKGYIEITSPGMYRIYLDRRRRRIEIWTGKGHHIVACDGMTDDEVSKLSEDETAFQEAVQQRESDTEPTLIAGKRNTSMPLRSSEEHLKSNYVIARTEGKRQLVLGDSIGDDELKTTALVSPDGSYLMMHESGGEESNVVEVYSAGKLNFFAEDEINMRSASANIQLDGTEVHFNSDKAPQMEEKLGDDTTVSKYVGDVEPWIEQPPKSKNVIKASEYPYFEEAEKIPGYEDQTST